MSQLTFDGFGAKPEKTAPAGVEVAEWYKGRVLSHSSIKTYRDCPQKWKFRYIDRIPDKPRSFFSFGKSVHAGLEFLYDRVRTARPALDELLDHYRGAWLRDGYESPAQEKWFFQEGERILRGFYAKHGADFQAVREVELKFTISVEGVPVTGYIDRIDNTAKGGLAIIDYKTGKAFDKSRVRNDPQLTLYQLAVETLLGKPVESVTLYHLNSLTPLTVPAHSPKMKDDLKATVLEAARGISDMKFDATPDEKGVCHYCDYAQICPALSARARASTKPASNAVAPLVDRFGKIDARIRELQAERSSLGEQLAGHLRSAGTGSVKGEHFVVDAAAGPDGSIGELTARPVEPDA